MPRRCLADDDPHLPPACCLPPPSLHNQHTRIFPKARALIESFLCPVLIGGEQPGEPPASQCWGRGLHPHGAPHWQSPCWPRREFGCSDNFMQRQQQLSPKKTHALFIKVSRASEPIRARPKVGRQLSPYLIPASLLRCVACRAFHFFVFCFTRVARLTASAPRAPRPVPTPSTRSAWRHGSVRGRLAAAAPASLSADCSGAAGAAHRRHHPSRHGFGGRRHKLQWQPAFCIDDDARSVLPRGVGRGIQHLRRLFTSCTVDARLV